MNIKQILVCVFLLTIGQELLSALSSRAGSLIPNMGTRSAGITHIPLISIIPSNIASRQTVNTSNSLIPVKQVNIPNSRYAQFKNVMQEAFQYARIAAETPIHMQTPLKFQKPLFMSEFPKETKSFLDLEIVKILKNKLLNYKVFLTTMIALSVLFGNDKLIDFLNRPTDKDDDTFLMAAIKNDNENLIEYLLQWNVDLYKQNKEGDTAIIIAAKLGKAKIFELLINNIKEKYQDDPKKAQEELSRLLNIQNNHGKTALLDVVEHGKFLGNQKLIDPTERERIDIIRLCLSNGADLSIQNHQGNNILFVLSDKMIADDKNSEILRELFDICAQHQPEIIQAINKNGYNLLDQALGNNNLYLFNYLKDKVNDPMHTDKYGQNIIFRALISGNITALQAVLDFVSDNQEMKSEKSKDVGMQKLLSLKDAQGFTVLDQAILRNRPMSFIRLLVDKGAQPTQESLTKVITQGNADLLKYFLDKFELSPNQGNLSLAFRSQHFALLKMLLNSKKINPTLKNAFIELSLLDSIKKENVERFNDVFAMSDSAVKQSIAQNVLDTGNIVIINDYLNSPQITDEVRQEMLQHALKSNESQQVIDALLNNKLSEKAYESSDFRNSILRDAFSKVKRNNTERMMNKTISYITEKDLKNDPLLTSLIVAWQPKDRSIVPSDKPYLWFLSKKEDTPNDNFDSKKRLYEKNIISFIDNENSNRKIINNDLKLIHEQSKENLNVSNAVHKTQEDKINDLLKGVHY